MKKVIALVMAVLVFGGWYVWNKTHHAPAPAVNEEKAKEEEPEVRFDLSPEETKALTDSGIAQTIVFLYRKASFRESLPDEYPIDPAGYQFSVLYRRGGRSDLCIGIKSLKVDTMTTYMGVNDYLKLQAEHRRVVGGILRNRGVK